MLEHIPKLVGEALQGARAGMDKVVAATPDFAGVPDSLTVSSPAFAGGGALPVRFTADGAGISPPLAWQDVPPAAVGLVLIVEDPDAPAFEPLVHVLAWALPPGDGRLAEGALKSPAGTGDAIALGQNSFLKAQYLPPDPPTGHGLHRYVFQVFALDHRLDLPDAPGRGAVVEAMRGHVLAKGTLIGTYERR